MKVISLKKKFIFTINEYKFFNNLKKKSLYISEQKNNKKSPFSFILNI